MLAILDILLPIFGLILTGYTCRRFDILGPTAASEINRLVAKLALPALLLHFTAHAHWSELYQPAFTATFALASMCIFVPVLVWRLHSGHALADASIDAISASYANTAYIGLPLCLMAYGHSSLAAVTIASIWVVCVMFAVAIVLIEIGLQQQQHPLHLLRNVLVALVKNPLITAPAAGILIATLKLSIPNGLDAYLDLLGTAAAPGALVSIGAFLASKRGGSGVRVALPLMMCKLIAMPLVAWLLATQVFHLSGEILQLALVLSALPTGTGPFMLAELYRREAQAASQAILLSTVGSMLTLSVILMLFHAT